MATASPSCPNGGRTTISGTVYDPAGKRPLANVAVFIPDGPLDPIKDGPACDACDPKTGTSTPSGQAVVVTKTDDHGEFHLGMTGEVPAGSDVPLVIQVGKWRREIVVPKVTACTDTMLTDIDQTRLPGKQSEGHIPKIALTTGASDALECLLRKIGISDVEFTPESGAGRVNLFQAGGGAPGYAPTVNAGALFTPANPWWDSYDNLAMYDLILLACEGSYGDYMATREPTYVKSEAARLAMEKYMNMGGRVFASHYHAYWFEKGSASLASIATFGRDAALPNPYTATIDDTSPLGSSLATWMFNVGGSASRGEVVIDQTAANRRVTAAAGGEISRRLVYASTLTPPSVLVLSANTPIPGGTCGRAVLTDLHVATGTLATAGLTDMPATPFPAGCVTTELSPREKVLEYLLFEMSGCARK
jgi:hypothetical protein